MGSSANGRAKVGLWIAQGGARFLSRSPSNRACKAPHCLLIEGLGESEGVIGHNALAILSYDDKQQRYRFRSWLFTGEFGDYDVSFTNGVLQWSGAAPNGSRFRFSIEVKDDAWLETGEATMDGKAWFKFFEMRPKRIR
jgi:hypothetical protein